MRSGRWSSPGIIPRARREIWTRFAHPRPTLTLYFFHNPCTRSRVCPRASSFSRRCVCRCPTPPSSHRRRTPT
jgi:hypothetical protein